MVQVAQGFHGGGWEDRVGGFPDALVRERCVAYADREVPVPTDAASDFGPDLDLVFVDPKAQDTETLAESIVTLSAHLHAGNHRLLVMVAEFDRRGGWKPEGHRSCADWLAFRTGTSLGPARERVRAARALEQLPLTSEAMARGELSFSKVRALSRVADDLPTPDEEVRLVAYARQCTAAQLETLVRGWKKLSRKDEVDLERERHRSRFFSVSPDEDGMYQVRGRLDPEVGALLMRALDAAGDALFRSERDWAAEGAARGPAVREITPRQRRADGLGLLLEQALRMGFGDAFADESVSAETSLEASAVAGAEASSPINGPEDARAAPISGTRAERYQVVLHVDMATLQMEHEEIPAGDGSAVRATGADARPTGPSSHSHFLEHAPGRSNLSDGTRVSAETSQRLCCDAAVVEAVRGREGEVLDVGRRTRTIPPALRRALEVRDRGCRFPGCGLRFAEGHHIVHWAAGGETKLSNLVLLCRFHHRAVHEEGFTVKVVSGRCGLHASSDQIRFFDRNGWPLPDAAPPPLLKHPLKHPLSRLVAAQHRQGVRPDGDTPAARWKRAGDIPWELEAEALEALDFDPVG